MTRRPLVCKRCGRPADLRDGLCAACRRATAPTEPPARGSRPDVDPGELEGAIVGDFQIERTIGRGGMGTVYAARQISMQRDVALKVLDRGVTMSNEDVVRFEREAWIAGRLNHPNIVKAFAQGTHGGRHYLAMELVAGRSLHEAIQEERARRRAGAAERSTRMIRARLRERVEQFVGVADALEHVHRHGIVHRDVKPLNLLFDEGETRLVLTDFGLARDDDGTRLTRRGDFFGTVRYMSPEQLMAHRVRIDHRTDIYSLGVTIYEAVTLDLPFSADSDEAYLAAVSSRSPEPARRRVRTIPRELDTILGRCLERDPEQRYATAAALRDDLRRWLDDRPILARRPSLLRRMRPGVRRHRVTITAVLLMLVAGATAIGVANWTTGRAHALERIRDTLAEVVARNTSPTRATPDWPELQAVLREEVGRDPRGELARLAYRAALGLRPSLPAYGLLSDLPDLTITAACDSMLATGRDVLWGIDVDAAWDDGAWSRVAEGSLLWPRDGVGPHLYGCAFPLAEMIPAQLLTPGPHRLDLRAHVRVWEGRSVAELVAADRRLHPRMILLGWPDGWRFDLRPEPPAFEERVDLGSLPLVLFERFPADFPRAVRQDTGPARLTECLRPDTVTITRVAVGAAGEAGQRPGIAVPLGGGKGRIGGAPPLGADLSVPFPAALGIGLVLWPARLDVPLAVRCEVHLRDQTVALAEFSLAMRAEDDLWLLAPASYSTATEARRGDRRLAAHLLLASVGPQGPPPRCRPDLPPDGVHAGWLDMTPSRAVARATRYLERYWDFGATVSVPVTIVVRSHEAAPEPG